MLIRDKWFVILKEMNVERTKWFGIDRGREH